jgi:16S rRNA (cytosine967-C5)-methyltransferase
MSSRTLFRHAVDLLQAIVDSPQPADKHMELYFRNHRQLGVRDRGFVAETVYGCLRRRRFLEYIADAIPARPADQVAIYLLLTQGWSARAVEDAGYRPAKHNSGGQGVRDYAARLHTPATDLPLGAQTDLPDWLLDKLLAQYGEAGTRALAAALNQPASLDLRVNTLKAERAEVAEKLAAEGYPVEVTPYSPVGLRRHERAPLFKTQAFQAGLFEVQDEGSQLLAPLLEARRHEMVVDFCAGAGGKTLHLGALMANSGSLYAFDVAQKRLDRLKPRLLRAGLDNVRMIAIAHERDARVRRLAGKVDRVLVDAPCTGTGTLRRNPDSKWREPDLAATTATQARILAAAASLVKPGGRLVYATCSLLRAENDDIVTAFLADHPAFRPLPAGEILARRGIAITLADDALRLMPHVHHTDGFYALAMERGK